MSTNLHELLREGLDRLTDGANVPDGLVRRAQQHNRRRQIRVRATIAAGTAVAAAATVVTVSLATTGNKPGNTTVQTQNVADVITRTEHALAAAADHGDAIQMSRESAPGGVFGLAAVGPGGVIGNERPSQPLPGARAAVTAQHMMTWSYHGLYLQEGFSAARKLVFVNVMAPTTLHSGKPAVVAYGAAYPVQTRWRTVIDGSSDGRTTLDCQTLPSAYPSWRATITKALSCGLFRLSGRQYVDGVDAMTLVSQPHRGLPLHYTIWLDPATYLPVRTSATFLTGPNRGEHVVWDLRFLPPTKANLAALHAAVRRASIPAAFRSLPPGDFVVAVSGS